MIPNIGDIIGVNSCPVRPKPKFKYLVCILQPISVQFKEAAKDRGCNEKFDLKKTITNLTKSKKTEINYDRNS
jgi:hypothetical protein